MDEKEKAWQTLEEILLQHGGSKVIRQNDTLNDLKKLISNGDIFTTTSTICRPMIPSQCHYNSARLWEDETDGTLDIMTGYALSDDGWRQHSWLIVSTDTTLDAYIDNDGNKQPEVTVSKGTIIETTVRRNMYYGYKLSGKDRDRFIFMNR